MDHNIITSIFLSEFHDLVGRQIIYQISNDPDQDITTKEFDKIADFVIPRQELCGKLITISFRNNYYIIGIPMLLRNRDQKVYNREIYIFSLSIIVDYQKYQERKYIFLEMARKLALFFTSIEMEHHLIYRTKLSQIQDLLNHIFRQLRAKKECYIEFNEEHYLFLKYIDVIVPYNEIKKQIKEHDVPIPMVQKNLIEQPLQEYDTKLYSAFNVINGIKCVKRLAEELSVSFSKLKEYMQTLLDHGMIKMVDIFRFSNHYEILPEIHIFLKNEVMRKACISYVLRQDQQQKSDQAFINEILNLYLQFQKDKSITDFFKKAENKQKLQKINLIEFLNFGLINGLIRRVHEYPLLNKLYSPKLKIINEDNLSLIKRNIFNEQDQIEQDDSKKEEQFNQEMHKMLTGNCCLDEIMIHFQINRDIFLKIVGPYCTLIYK